MRAAGLDSSGPNYAFIGVIVGEEVDLRSLYTAVKGGRRRIHMRRLGRGARREVAARLLEEIAEAGGSLCALSIRTGVADALAEARLRAPYAPSSMLRRRCLRLLALLIWEVLEDHGVGRVYCDRELVEAFALAGIRVGSASYAVELADVIAWLDFRRWPLGRPSPVVRLDFSETLASRLLKEAGR